MKEIINNNNNKTVKNFIIKTTAITSLIVWILGSHTSNFLKSLSNLLIDPLFSIDLDQNGIPDLKELDKYNVTIGNTTIGHKNDPGLVTFGNGIVTVTGEDNVMVGAGLFTYSRDSGFYSVGAYKRELSDQPLGHAVQMKAIETFKKNGVKWYEIGLKRLKIDKKTPTDKELALTHFKQGFATNIAARQHLTVDLNID